MAGTGSSSVRFVTDKAFHEVLGGVDNRTTLLLGHTRWRTRGDEQVNENNHPIRAGDILGTHNGTTYNANTLFRRFKLRRFAEVDSELLFRLAARAGRNGRIDIDRFKDRLRLCRGQMAAVLASLLDPETVLVLKGNKPLELRFHKRHRAVIYASDPAYLDAVLDEELKRGYWNHEPFCEGALEIREARVRGRLYDGPGFPILEVPDKDILAYGTAEPLADVATQARLSSRVGSSSRPVPESATAGAWGAVYGELLTFDDPASRLPAIDRLEGFRPGGSSLYRRVLVPVTVDGAPELAWVYTVETTGIKQRRIVSGCWPE